MPHMNDSSEQQVTAKHACTLRMWLCVKWRDMVHACMAYTERARRQQCHVAPGM